MPGFNTIPVTGGGGGQPNMTYVASIHMSTYNRSWAQGGTAGYYAIYSTNQENGYAYFVGSTTTGIPLNRLVSISHSFTRIDVVAPQNDMLSLYKAKVKATTEFLNPLANFASFPSLITSSGNFVLPNNALPLVNVLLAGGGGTGYHHGGGGAGGGVVKLTAYQAVGTTSITIGSGRSGTGSASPGGATYFGNVYALGGQSAVDHNSDPTPAATNPYSNGAGATAYNGATRNGGAGFTQTATTGLGTSGSPVYIGGYRGGNSTANTGSHRHLGGSGGGAGGIGQDKNGGTGGTTGGLGHYSDMSGTNTYFGMGGGGSDHHGNSSSGNGSYPSHSGPAYGHGGTSYYNSQDSGGQGAVIVRYYIP